MREITERRQIARYCLTVPLTATIKWNEAVIVDLSLRGARMRHPRAVALGDLRLRFHWGGVSFDEIVRIVSSRAVAGGGGIEFESGVQFGAMTDDSREALTGLVSALPS